MITANQLHSLSRHQKLALYYNLVYNEKKQRSTGTQDIWKQYKDNPVHFITRGLRQLQEDSWKPWRIVLKAAFAVPLNEEELIFFREVAHRDPPKKRVKELWLIIGRRGGKDSIASLIAVNAARFADSGTALRPGEKALVACLAVNRDQASIVFNYIKGYFEKIPRLQNWLSEDLPKSYRSGPISLTNNTEIQVTTNNFRAPRGRPIACAIFDEVAFWRDERSATPDKETFNAIRPGMATIPDAMLIGISTPYRKTGLLYEKYSKNFGIDDDDILVIKADTAKFNPLIDRQIILDAYRDDPQAAAAEWGAEFREDLEDYVSEEVINAVILKDRYETLPSPFHKYVGFVDPSGGSRDSFTLAIAHGEFKNNTQIPILDCIREVHAPFSPESVVIEFSDVLKSYNVNKITGDKYAGQWPVEQFQKRGIIYEQSELIKSDIYLNFLPLMNSANVELLDNQRMKNQFRGLERRRIRGGRDRIDHPPGGYDDVANAVAGACLMVSSDPLSVWRRLVS